MCFRLVNPLALAQLLTTLHILQFLIVKTHHQCGLSGNTQQ